MVLLHWRSSFSMLPREPSRGAWPLPTDVVADGGRGGDRDGRDLRAHREAQRMAVSAVRLSSVRSYATAMERSSAASELTSRASTTGTRARRTSVGLPAEARAGGRPGGGRRRRRGQARRHGVGGVVVRAVANAEGIAQVGPVRALQGLNRALSSVLDELRLDVDLVRAEAGVGEDVTHRVRHGGHDVRHTEAPATRSRRELVRETDRVSASLGCVTWATTVGISVMRA